MEFPSYFRSESPERGLGESVPPRPVRTGPAGRRPPPI